jgi:hypothetical protein
LQQAGFLHADLPVLEARALPLLKPALSNNLIITLGNRKTAKASTILGGSIFVSNILDSFSAA